MQIALILIHNKSDSGNFTQIENLKPYLNTIVDSFTDPDSGEVFTMTHHEIKGLNISHTVKIYQIVPFGKSPPSNIYDINSGGIVYYGAGDEDKTGTHPRFFNWGVKRGLNIGADIAIYLSDLSQFTLQSAKNSINKLTGDTQFVETPFGKLVMPKLFKRLQGLKENINFTDAVSDFKTRVIGEGLKNG